MPELPEVEVITRGLKPHLRGNTILNIWYSGKKLRAPVEFELLRKRVVGTKILDVSRRAKFIQLPLENGALMIIHLGMTGNLGIFDIRRDRLKHDHFEWDLGNSQLLRYNDTRRFGAIYYLEPEQAQDLEDSFYKTSGPEPFAPEFSQDYLFHLAQNRTTTVKQLIMNNSIVAGVGNIYANESLYQCGINPGRKAQTLTKNECQSLIASIRQVLTQAIECGGSTISDFKSASQESGYFQINFKVYGKEGEKCGVCSSPIKKTSLGGRASFFCERCQQ